MSDVIIFVQAREEERRLVDVHKLGVVHKICLLRPRITNPLYVNMQCAKTTKNAHQI